MAMLLHEEVILPLVIGIMILLMEEILHHLGCMKPLKWWDKPPISWLAGFLNHQQYLSDKTGIPNHLRQARFNLKVFGSPIVSKIHWALFCLVFGTFFSPGLLVPRAYSKTKTFKCGDPHVWSSKAVALGSSRNFVESLQFFVWGSPHMTIELWWDWWWVLPVGCHHWSWEMFIDLTRITRDTLPKTNGNRP